MPSSHPHPLAETANRIANALERLSPPPPTLPDMENADAFVWSAAEKKLLPVTHVNAVELELLHGIDYVRDQLLDNTRNFAEGFSANNALLWGARGTGKSSLVKAIHQELARDYPIKIVEIHSEDLASLPLLTTLLKQTAYRIIVFCDDLSFDSGDATYKALKTLLDGGLEGRPENLVFYATSNRRHLMPRDMIENERSTAIHPGEAVEEKVSLSDRFGLWLSFHHISQDDYLAMVTDYVRHFRIPLEAEELRAEALEWSTTRGSRSGRVAWQFIQHLAGKHKVKI